jgi:7-cyano-7-deazaguanine reductase
MQGYTAAHAGAGIQTPLPKIDTWPNQFPGYQITVRVPEYTLICPKTGLPDYGTILRDIVAAVEPAWCRLTGDFAPHGGLTTSIEAYRPRRRGNTGRAKR